MKKIFTWQKWSCMMLECTFHSDLGCLNVRWIFWTPPSRHVICIGLVDCNGKSPIGNSFWSQICLDEKIYVYFVQVWLPDSHFCYSILALYLNITFFVLICLNKWIKFCAFSICLAFKIFCWARLVSGAAFLWSKRFFRHQYGWPWFNYEVYGNYGHIHNMVIMAILP